MALYDSYEQQYSVLTADITANIGRFSVTTSPEESGQLLVKIDKSIDEAKELLEQMELEVREIEVSQRSKYKTRLDCYKTELQRLCQEFINAKSTNSNNSDYYSDFTDVRLSEEHNRRLLENSERIERTGRKLNDGYRILMETEQVGSQVLQDLSAQRETIQRSRARLRETDADLGRSSRLMNWMVMRMIQERLLLFIVGFAFTGAVTFGLYMTFSRKN